MYRFFNMIVEFKLSMFFRQWDCCWTWHVVSQCFIIFARYICFNLLCFTTGIRLVLAFLFQSTTDYDATNLLGRDLLLHSAMSTEQRRKLEAWAFVLGKCFLSSRIGARSMSITFTIPFYFLQHFLSLNNCRIKTLDMSQDLRHLHLRLKRPRHLEDIL